MEMMGLAAFLKYGTPGLFVVLIILMVYILVTLKRVQQDIRDMKNSMVWNKECDFRHEPIDKDMERLKNKVFNGNNN